MELSIKAPQDDYDVIFEAPSKSPPPMDEVMIPHLIYTQDKMDN